LLLAALSTASALIIPPHSGAEQRPLLDSSHGSQKHLQDHLGAVASESSICSQIGIDLLREGGNAADALVGTVFCVGVIGMYHSGIGGGGFMLVRGSDGTYEDIDFRESAPAAYYQDMYNDDPMTSVFGGLAR
jgi:gamma-glutamyltranspeptidase/glutathione hydrolase